MFKRLYEFLFAVPPKIGSVWSMDITNPFNRIEVVVKAVKEGWVQYAFPFGYISELSIREFRSVYREIKLNEDVEA